MAAQTFRLVKIEDVLEMIEMLEKMHRKQLEEVYQQKEEIKYPSSTLDYKEGRSDGSLTTLETLKEYILKEFNLQRQHNA